MKSEQVGPDAAVLAWLVKQLTYKPNWQFQLVGNYDRGQGSKGLTLLIYVTTPDSLARYGESPIRVLHLMPVPPAGYNRKNWQRWLIEQVILVERHETMEFFKIDGRAPYFPNHGDGNDPYTF